MEESAANQWATVGELPQRIATVENVVASHGRALSEVPTRINAVEERIHAHGKKTVEVMETVTKSQEETLNLCKRIDEVRAKASAELGAVKAQVVEAVAAVREEARIRDREVQAVVEVCRVTREKVEQMAMAPAKKGKELPTPIVSVETEMEVSRLKAPSGHSRRPWRRWPRRRSARPSRTTSSQASTERKWRR
jgi:DNA repair exonuclease SbcCD ATPase subunit